MAKSIKYAFFIPALNGGGAQRVLINLVNCLSRNSWAEVHLVLVRKEGVFLDKVDPAVKIFYLNSRRTIWSLPALISYLRSERPGVFMSSLRYANIVAVISSIAAGYRGKVILRETNVLIAPRGFLRGLKFRTLVWMMRVLYPKASALVANSKDTVESLQRVGINIGKSLIISNPIDFSTLVTQAGQATDLEYVIVGSRYICAAGRLEDQKGFDILINAFSLLKQTDVYLVIMGDGPRREALVNQANDLGLSDRVKFLGFVENSASIMDKADVFVLSSRWEGLPNVLLEALALGVPIVATDCPGNVRDVLEDGKHGYLVPVGNEVQLAEKIQLSLNGAEAGSKGGRVARAREFSVEHITLEYLDKAFGLPRL